MNITSFLPKYDFDKATGWRINLPYCIEPGNRVLCLYRVSTNKQLYHTEQNEADIPMQRIRCREFCERMGWTLVCELQEEGVSGHKVRAEQRDKVQLIKEYAKQGKFDILLVFMFDRIGRIADETPFVVEWLIKNNIRVWSTQEGEQKIETHTDRLTNYIRYWQADGESQKISARTSNSMGVLTEEGCFTGGLCAYGYQYVKLGRTNRRKQEVLDLAICEEEADIVRLIFRLATEEGCGAQRIANQLNAKGVKNRSGKNWHPASIRGMLKNILYTGVLRSGKSHSDVIERLQIIDSKTFEEVQAMSAMRSQKQAAIRSIPLNTRGNALLSGNIFCGHCGARLCITTSGKGGNSNVRRVRYTCQTKSRTHGDCDGQTGYTVSKLDAMIDAIIRSIFERAKRLRKEEVMDVCYHNDMKLKYSVLKKLQRDYDKAITDLERLKAEVVKTLTGESDYSPALLNGLIAENEHRCADLKVAMANAERDITESKDHIAQLSARYDELLSWSSAYETANMAMKKMIVSKIIDRVDVYRDYHLKLKLNISMEQVLIGMNGECISANCCPA